MIALLAAAWAGPVEDARDVQLARVRVEVAGEVQLSAFDLVDELVLAWRDQPVFDQPTPVVVASVTVPVGLGTGLQALVENHLADVIGRNPTTNIQLAHCPRCSAVVVHSGPEATVISRGIDDPQVLAELGAASGQHALFVDIEAEGRWLVLRARITRLTPELPIVWSHTISSAAGTPSLLRQPDDLKSAADARAEYLAALRDRGPILIPVRFAVRSYFAPDEGGLGIAPPPFLWLQSGVELGATESGAWTSSLLLGVSFIPQAYQGVMGQARFSRLISGRYRSLTQPNVYLFAGGAVMSVWGPATAPFALEALDADQILAAALGDGPRTTFGALHLGLDVRFGTRIGASVFVETLPAFNRSPNIGRWIRILGIEAHSLGTEVTFCF